LQAKSQKIPKFKKQLLDFLAFDRTLNKRCFKAAFSATSQTIFELVAKSFWNTFFKFL